MGTKLNKLKIYWLSFTVLAAIFLAGVVVSNGLFLHKKIIFVLADVPVLKNNPSFQFQLGQAYFNDEDYSRAFDQFNRLLRAHPNHGPAYVARGRILKFMAHNERALDDFESALKCDPNDAAALYERGLIYKDKGESDQALSDFNGALSSDPKMYKAYNARGEVYRDLGQLDNAVVDFERSLKINPEYWDAYKNKIALAEKKTGNDRSK